MKKTITVTKTTQIEIELTPSMFGEMTHDEFLKDYSASFHHVTSTDDLMRYAAACIANGQDYGTIEGLGEVGSDVKYDILFDDIETEIEKG